MEDQRTDRAGGRSVTEWFQISLWRVFGATFWACVFLGSLSLTIHWNSLPADEQLRQAASGNWWTSLYSAVVTIFLFLSPGLSLGAICGRPVMGLVIGAILLFFGLILIA
jgi:hypothetical protein